MYNIMQSAIAQALGVAPQVSAESYLQATERTARRRAVRTLVHEVRRAQAQGVELASLPLTPREREVARRVHLFENPQVGVASLYLMRR